MSLEKRNVAEDKRTHCDKCSALVCGGSLHKTGPILCTGCRARSMSKQASDEPTLKELPDRLVKEWGA